MTEAKAVTPPDRKEHFEYLDVLRESGATNMFGAAPYLQDEFDLSKSEAREILNHWMKTFSARKDAGEVKEAPYLAGLDWADDDDEEDED